MDPIVCILSRKVFITAVTEKNSKKNLNLCIKDNVKTLVQFLFFPRQVVCETLECGGEERKYVIWWSSFQLENWKKEATHVKTSFRTYCRHVLDYFKRFRSAIKEHTIVINSQKKSSFYRCNNYFESSILNNNSLLLQCKVPTTQGKEDKYLHNKLSD